MEEKTVFYGSVQWKGCEAGSQVNLNLNPGFVTDSFITLENEPFLSLNFFIWKKETIISTLHSLWQD